MRIFLWGKVVVSFVLHKTFLQSNVMNCLISRILTVHTANAYIMFAGVSPPTQDSLVKTINNEVPRETKLHIPYVILCGSRHQKICSECLHQPHAYNNVHTSIFLCMLRISPHHHVQMEKSLWPLVTITPHT